MIYIDPPYNTGKDFVYRDNFKKNKTDYELELGRDDEESGERLFRNTETNGRFHSDWCSMIYPRLKLARDFLRDDGVIFISIDDNEVANLRKICDEVFGEGNFVSQFIWERAYAPKNDAKFVSNSHDYVLMFAKQLDRFTIGRLERTDEANSRYSNPDNDSRGVWKPSDMSVKTYTESCDYPITTPSGRIVEPPAGRCWSLSKNAFLERLQDNRIWFGPKGDSTPSIKRFLAELKFDGMAPTSILFYKEVGHSQEGAKEVKDLIDGNGIFDGPKPVPFFVLFVVCFGLKAFPAVFCLPKVRHLAFYCVRISFVYAAPQSCKHQIRIRIQLNYRIIMQLHIASYVRQFSVAQLGYVKASVEFMIAGYCIDFFVIAACLVPEWVCFV